MILKIASKRYKDEFESIWALPSNIFIFARKQPQGMKWEQLTIRWKDLNRSLST